LHVDQKGSEAFVAGERCAVPELRIERDITIFPDDVFLTLTPIGQYVDPVSGGQSRAYGRAVTFLNVSGGSDMLQARRPITCGTCRRPRILKSHEASPEVQAVIYIVRDPRDVAVSTITGK